MKRDVGYEPTRLPVADVEKPTHTTLEAQTVVQEFSGLFTQLGSLPGVKHVAGIMGLPMGNYGSDGEYVTRGGVQDTATYTDAASAVFSVASPGYFQTLGIPVKRGRDFKSGDTYESEFVAVISEALAKQSFGNMDPLGKQIQCGLDSDKWMTVVGVVGDVRQGSPAETPGPASYMPSAQHPSYGTQIHIVMRTGVAPLALMNAARETIARRDASIAMRFTTMDEMLSESVATERFRAALIGSFAGVALVLVMLGVYGTVAYTVARRTFDIGMRMALGAEKGRIMREVLVGAAKLGAWGVVVGVGLSLMMAQLVKSMLVGVRTSDPVSLGGAVGLLLLTVVVAAFVPGWRATRVDPMVALRME